MTKDERLQVRVDPVSKSLLERAAQASDVSVSAFVLQSATARAVDVLAERQLRRPEPLDPQRHDRSAFESGSPDLDEWLRRYSGQNRRRNTAAIWVIATADMAVVAYVSLAMTGIDRSAAPSLVAKGAPDPVPASLIGGLAVD